MFTFWMTLVNGTLIVAIRPKRPVEHQFDGSKGAARPKSHTSLLGAAAITFGIGCLIGVSLGG